MTERRKACVCVDEVYVFPEQDGTEVRKRGEEIGEGGRSCDGQERDVVDFKARENPPDADAIWGMAMGYDDDLGPAQAIDKIKMKSIWESNAYLVPPFYEVCAQHVNVVFYTANVRVEEVRYHTLVNRVYQ